MLHRHQSHYPSLQSARWKDGNSLSMRAVFAILRASFTTRRLLLELRSVGGLAWATFLLLVLSLVVRSWILFVALGVLSAANLVQWLYFRFLLSRAGLDEVDEMTGWEFERWVRRFLERAGYHVESTPYRGDFGADLVATWNGVRTAVQVKRSARAVGIRAVQEVAAAKGYYGCERAMVVSNGYYTDQALILARANGVLLRSRDDLARKLAELDGPTRVPAEPSTSSR